MEFIDNSAKIKDEITYQAIRALKEICMMVEAQAVLLAPSDTGNLREHISHMVDRQELIGYVGTNVSYAIYVEFGTGEFAEKGNGRKGGWLYTTPDGKSYFTRGNKPQPYLRPAFRKNKKQIQAIFETYLSQIGG
ncbi:TPA: HK97-gp10 family putative phage morphogenesis protein [Streptococcus suis]